LQARRTTFIGIFLVSFSTLLLEINLTRIFSASFSYHFAFMIISLALFGFGLSGIVLYLFPRFFTRERALAQMCGAVLIFALSMFVILFILLNLPIAPSLSRLGFVVLAFLYILNSIPFFFAGLCLALAFSHLTGQISVLYFCDLIGAGIGCLLSIPLLNLLGAPTSVLLAGTLAAGAGFTFSLSYRDGLPARSMQKVITRRMLTAIIILFCAALFLSVGKPLIFAFLKALYGVLPHTRSFSENLYRIEPLYNDLARYLRTVMSAGILSGLLAILIAGLLRNKKTPTRKIIRLNRTFIPSLSITLFLGLLVIHNVWKGNLDFHFVKGQLLGELLYRKWNALSWVIVHPGNTRAESDKRNIGAWGMSPVYSGPIVDQYGLRIDAYAGTPITRFDGDIEKVKFVTHDIPALVYYIRSKPKVLVIGAGGGIDILAALCAGSEDVTGIEINPAVVEAMRGPFRDFSGNIYDLPRVRTEVAEGRNFIRRSREKYDVIQLSMVDSLAAASSGAYALSENNLYTVEAFTEYLNHLSEDGILTMSRYALQSLRTVSLALEALEKLGAKNPARHITVFRSGRIGNLLLKRSPFTEREIEILEDTAGRLQFEILYTPRTRGVPDFTRLISSPDRRKICREHPFDITPTTDNKPFFFQTMRPRDFASILFVPEKFLIGNQAVFSLVSVLIIVTFLAVVFLFGPLLLFKREVLTARPRLRLSTLFYFFCIGLAFMLLEIPLIQMFVLFLGHPTYSLSVVLFSLLVSCGLGSFLTRRFQPERLLRSLRNVILGIGIWSMVGLVFLPPIFYRFLDTGLTVRIIISLVFLIPLGLVMGMAFPVGIKIADRRWHAAVPWFWGINGAASVMGSVWALTLSISFGFRLTFVTATVAYLLGLLALSVGVRKVPAAGYDIGSAPS